MYQTKFTIDNVSEIGNLGRERFQGVHTQTFQAPQGGPSFTMPIPGYGATELGADGTGTTGEATALPTENHGWLQADGKSAGTGPSFPPVTSCCCSCPDAPLASPGQGTDTAASPSQTTAANTLPDDGKGVNITPEEARTEFFGLLDEIQAMAAGDWLNEDIPAGGYCNYQGTGNGKSFAGARTMGPLSATERETLRQKVEHFYESRGYSIKVFDQSTTTNKLLMTNGFGPDGLVIQLYTGDLGTVVDGFSRCVPDPDGSK